LCHKSGPEAEAEHGFGQKKPAARFRRHEKKTLKGFLRNYKGRQQRMKGASDQLSLTIAAVRAKTFNRLACVNGGHQPAVCMLLHWVELLQTLYPRAQPRSFWPLRREDLFNIVSGTEKGKSMHSDHEQLRARLLPWIEQQSDPGVTAVCLLRHGLALCSRLHHKLARRGICDDAAGVRMLLERANLPLCLTGMEQVYHIVSTAEKQREQVWHLELQTAPEAAHLLSCPRILTKSPTPPPSPARPASRRPLTPPRCF
jgi:hypothetical protein